MNNVRVWVLGGVFQLDDAGLKQALALERAGCALKVDVPLKRMTVYGTPPSEPTWDRDDADSAWDLMCYGARRPRMGWLARRRRAWFEREFAARFLRAFERIHAVWYEGGIAPENKRAFHPGHGHSYIEGEILENAKAVGDLRSRLARLECPAHKFTSDKCVKCGAPRPGGDAGRKQGKRHSR